MQDFAPFIPELQGALSGPRPYRAQSKLGVAEGCAFRINLPATFQFSLATSKSIDIPGMSCLIRLKFELLLCHKQVVCSISIRTGKNDLFKQLFGWFNCQHKKNKWVNFFLSKIRSEIDLVVDGQITSWFIFITLLILILGVLTVRYIVHCNWIFSLNLAGDVYNCSRRYYFITRFK